MYGITPDPLYMIATSEHPLTSICMDEVIEPNLLPIKMVGVSACFRREVGAHGLSDRGIWRVHQFTKIEQIVISHPDESWDHHEELLQNCVDLWDKLGLHYEVNICTEIWEQSLQGSMTLRLGYQVQMHSRKLFRVLTARTTKQNRLRMRYRTAEGNAAVHTLNSTAVATSRALVAIMEQNQLEDGRVRVPECLIPMMGGKTISNLASGDKMRRATFIVLTFFWHLLADALVRTWRKPPVTPALEVEAVASATRGQYMSIAVDSTVDWTVNRSPGLFFMDEFGVLRDAESMTFPASQETLEFLVMDSERMDIQLEITAEGQNLECYTYTRRQFRNDAGRWS